jgi:hypothetical protein
MTPVKREDEALIPGEGEFVPGSPAQRYYYGIDQIGSVRRAFASDVGVRVNFCCSVRLLQRIQNTSLKTVLTHSRTRQAPPLVL